jgi:hypothetical protein
VRRSLAPLPAQKEEAEIDAPPIPPEPPPEPQLDTATPRSAPPVAPDAREEEEAEIAALRIPPWTTDDELVALWLHGKSPDTIRAYGEDVTAFRAFTGKGVRSTYLSDLRRYADALVGARRRAPGACGRSSRSSRSLLRWVTRPSMSGPPSGGPSSSTNSRSGF